MSSVAQPAWPAGRCLGFGHRAVQASRLDSEQGIAPWLAYSYLHVPAHVWYLTREWFKLVAAEVGLELRHWNAEQDVGQAFEAVLTKPHRGRRVLHCRRVLLPLLVVKE